jgi:hypothetical protein
MNKRRAHQRQSSFPEKSLHLGSSPSSAQFHLHMIRSQASPCKLPSLPIVPSPLRGTSAPRSQLPRPRSANCIGSTCVICTPGQTSTDLRAAARVQRRGLSHEGKRSHAHNVHPLCSTSAPACCEAEARVHQATLEAPRNNVCQA